jgi:hypothetical protein
MLPAATTSCAKAPATFRWHGGVFLQATAHEDLKRLLGKAQAIDEIESTIPSWIEKLMPHNYPAFVHVLRVSGEPLSKHMSA